MQMLRRVLAILLALHMSGYLGLLSFLLPLAFAQTVPTRYWVAASGGSTAGACGDADGASDPGVYYRTIDGAIGCMAGGDIVVVKAGVYTTPITAEPPSGSASAFSTIQCETVASCIIRPTGARAINWSVALGQTRNYYAVKGFNFDMVNAPGANGIQTSNGRFGNVLYEDLDIYNLITTSVGSIAINVGGPNPDIDSGNGLGNFTLRRVTARDAWRQTAGIGNGGTGIYYQAPGPLVIEDSIFTNLKSGDTSILIQSNGYEQPGPFIIRRTICSDGGNPSDSGSTCISANQRDVRVENSLIFGNQFAAVRVKRYGDVHIRNNVFYNNGSGIVKNDGTTGSTITNNIFVSTGTAIGGTGTSTDTNNSTAGVAGSTFVNAGADNFNILASTTESNGTDLTSVGILHNNLPGRGALDPMQFASAVTLDANTVRVCVHNSFGALRNPTTTTGWTVKVGGSAKTVTAAAASGNTCLDLDINFTMDDTSVVLASYSSTTGSLLNSIGIGDFSDARGNAYLLSFTDQAVTNTLTAGGGGGEENPPATASVGHSEETADTTTPDAVMPTSIVAGDLLLAFLSFNGIPTVSAGITGFTQLCRAANSNVSGEWWYKIAAGGESDTTYTLSSAENSITRIWRIPVAVWHGTTQPECATASGSSAIPDPPLLSASWAGLENLRTFASYSRFRGDSLLSAYPANYADDQFTDDTGSLSSTVQMGVASRAINSAVEDPGNFTTGTGSQNWVAFTVAIRAVGEGAGGGGEPVATWEQRDFCWKNWQDAETAACSFGQNVTGKSHPNGKIVARIGIGVTAANPDPSAHVADYRLTPASTGVPGSWIAIAGDCTAPCVKYTPPQIRSSGQATTRLLALPGGLTFAAGQLQAAQGPSAVFDYAQDVWTEFDQAIELVGLSQGDIIEMRMRKEVGDLYTTYTKYATLVVEGTTASAF